MSIYFCYFVIISPWKRMCPRSSEQTWILLTQVYFAPSLIKKLALWFWRRILTMFLLFCFISPWKRVWAFIWIWIPFAHWMLCVKISWNSNSTGSVKQDENVKWTTTMDNGHWILIRKSSPSWAFSSSELKNKTVLMTN